MTRTHQIVLYGLLLVCLVMARLYSLGMETPMALVFLLWPPDEKPRQYRK